MFKEEIGELEKLAELFNFDAIPQSFKENWEAAMMVCPKETPFFLKDAFIDKTLKRIGILNELNHKFKKTAKMVKEDEEIFKIVWLWYYMCYIEYDLRGIYSWPHLCDALGKYGNIVPMLVLLAGYNDMIEYYEMKGIPEDIRETVYGAIRSSFKRFKNRYDEPGRGNSVLAWVVRYFTGNLYYIGRLQYEFTDCYSKISVYRHFNTGEVVCLVDRNQTYNLGGKHLGTNGIESKENNYIYGYPISPESYVIDKELVLDRKEWELVLKEGDPAISIHIPGGSSLEYEAVKESLVQAESFFSTYFSEYKWRVFYCNSWLLDPQLRQFLRTDSNIVRFQDAFYMFPIDSPDTTGVYKFLFNTKECSPEELQAETSLQKSVKNHLIKGGTINSGGGFILREDLDRPIGHYRESFRWGDSHASY